MTSSFCFLSVCSCWMNETPYTNILVAPVCISMMLNLMFLCNIVRVLFMKLRAPAGPQGGAPSRNILQAFRYVLIRITGLHILVKKIHTDFHSSCSLLKYSENCKLFSCQ